jgi:hypothetical protein
MSKTMCRALRPVSFTDFLRRVVEQIVKSISFPKNRHDWARHEAKELYLSDSFECDVPTTCTRYHQNPFTSFQLRPCGRIDTSSALCVNFVLLAQRLRTNSVPVSMKILLVCYKDRSAKLYSRSLGLWV